MRMLAWSCGVDLSVGLTGEIEAKTHKPAGRMPAGLRLSGFWWTWRSRGIVQRGLECLPELAHGFFEQFVDGCAGALTQVIQNGHLCGRETAGWPLIARRFAIICRHVVDSCSVVDIPVTNAGGELSSGALRLRALHGTSTTHPPLRKLTAIEHRNIEPFIR